MLKVASLVVNSVEQYDNYRENLLDSWYTYCIFSGYAAFSFIYSYFPILLYDYIFILILSYSDSLIKKGQNLQATLNALLRQNIQLIDESLIRIWSNYAI